jgi:NADPH-dependent glutamate synthase beta subunit-like oxidoreductase/coenzyme F420-reducing hydrogenase delta subunit/Pyruvate/2-oxoacid:ferredoxin oxidoreductase delta subunit
MAVDKSRIFARLPDSGDRWELVTLETSPCTLACPARINVKGYVSLIADGCFEEALELIREMNPFPGVCGRICPRPCESACVRGDFDQPVAICALKRFVFDLEMERGIDERPQREITRPEKIAIVGAGPAGLSAARELERFGYPVTVFEAASKPGGMMNIIPEFRLPSRVVGREVNMILSGSVSLQCNTVFGRDVTWASLQKEGYRALLLATGASRPDRRLKTNSGENVVHALELLGAVSEGGVASGGGAVNSDEVSSSGTASGSTAGGGDVASGGGAVSSDDVSSSGGGMGGGSGPVSGNSSAGWASDLEGKRVVVAGGGVMGLDAARTAVRLGSRKVTLIMEHSRENAPFLSEYARQASGEGVDIKFLSRMKQIDGSSDKGYRVKYRRLKGVQMDRTGRERLEEGSREYSLEADVVVDAYSRSFNKRGLQTDFDLPRTALGWVRVDPGNMAVNKEGVFAAGDMVSGPKSVVEAVALGMKSAREIHYFVSGERVYSPFDIPAQSRSDRREYALTRLPREKEERAAMPLLSDKRRRREFTEAEAGMDKNRARREARRCLRCGTCAECEVCTDICDRKDYRLSVDDLQITLHADRDFWSAEPEDLIIEYGGRESHAELIRNACRVDITWCVGCGSCERICGYNAVMVGPGTDGVFTARVDLSACKGCGSCVSVCPTGAMDQTVLNREKIYKQLEGIVMARTSVIFVCGWVLPQLLELPEDTLCVEIGCAGRLNPAMILEAVSRGCRKVLVCRCDEGNCHYRSGEERAEEVIGQSKRLLEMLGLDPSLVADIRCSRNDFYDRIERFSKRKKVE